MAIRYKTLAACGPYQTGATAAVEMGFAIGSQHIWCSGVPTKTRLESMFCTSNKEATTKKPIEFMIALPSANRKQVSAVILPPHTPWRSCLWSQLQCGPVHLSPLMHAPAKQRKQANVTGKYSRGKETKKGIVFIMQHTGGHESSQIAALTRRGVGVCVCVGGGGVPVEGKRG